jgi:hypothetical protein
MKIEEELMVNWVDFRINELLRFHTSTISRFAFVMITTIDSSSDIAGIANGYRLFDIYGECSIHGEALLLPGDRIENLHQRFNLFNGFDEIWCFNERPRLVKSSDLSIVAPLNLAVDDTPPLLASWMKQSGCKLGLGDGIGMNIVTPDLSLMTMIEKCSFAS